MPDTKTMLTNLINPQVMGDYIRSKLVESIKFTPLAKVDTTLAGQAGNTITLPKYAYIGDATDVGEGEAIPITNLSATSTTVTVKKAAKGVDITDEAALSAYGDPIGEISTQIATANEKRQVLSGAVISNADKHIVRIPYDKNVTLSKGDIIIKGVATEDITDNSSGKEVLTTYTESFIVDVVKTNDKTKRLKHIYGGE